MWNQIRKYHRFISLAKGSKTIVLLFLTTLLLSQCTSCIHDNSYTFSVKNLTKDTLIITTEAIIPVFKVEVCSDPYNRNPDSLFYRMDYVNASDTIFMIPPYTEFNAWKYWETRDVLSDTPEADGVTPGWKFIKSMKLGGQLLPPEIWNSEQKWRIMVDYEDVERVYSLTISN